MCKKIFDESDITDKDYNFVVSSLILSQTKKFTYDDIIETLKGMFTNLNEKIENTVKSCLVRLREDGFLVVLGVNYSVVEVSI